MHDLAHTYFLAAGLLLALAGIAVLATSHLRLRERSARERARLERRQLERMVLHSLTRELAAGRNLDHVLAVVDRETAKLFDPDELCVALLDPRTAAVVPVYRRRRGCRPQTDSHPLAGPVLAAVIAEGRTVSMLPAARPGVHDLPSEGMASLLAAPLISEERAIGVVCLQSKTPDRWSDDDATLDTMVQTVALAVEGALESRRATVDSLTGMLRRERFFERLEEEHGRASRYGGDFTVLMVDLDGFKGINDLYGHLAGDRYLRRLGESVRDLLRTADVGGRYGGDEFCLLLPHTGIEGGRAIAERIRSAVSALVVEIDERKLRTTVSIGLASFAEHDTGDLHGLLQKADQALYRAKREGRDRVVPWAA